MRDHLILDRSSRRLAEYRNSGPTEDQCVFQLRKCFETAGWLIRSCAVSPQSQLAPYSPAEERYWYSIFFVYH
jgi:hypothetical protein